MFVQNIDVTLDIRREILVGHRDGFRDILMNSRQFIELLGESSIRSGEVGLVFVISGLRELIAGGNEVIQ